MLLKMKENTSRILIILCHGGIISYEVHYIRFLEVKIQNPVLYLFLRNEIVLFTTINYFEISKIKIFTKPFAMFNLRIKLCNIFQIKFKCIDKSNPDKDWECENFGFKKKKTFYNFFSLEKQKDIMLTKILFKNYNKKKFTKKNNSILLKVIIIILNNILSSHSHIKACKKIVYIDLSLPILF